MNKIVDRKEDMSREGFLRIIEQEDGDIIVGIFECDRNDRISNVASVEFCTIISGGGSSPDTLKALRALSKAMALDNRKKDNKCGEFLGEEFLDV